MKKLLIIRHSKSSWKDPSKEDYDRPLNKRGKRDAPFMGRLLNNNGLFPDKIVSSGAKRARKTAKIIKEQLVFEKDIEFNDDIYYKDEEDIVSLIKQTSDDVETLYLIGHNPMLNFLAYHFVDFVENIPTTGIVSVEFDVTSWSDISPSNATLDRFEYPKKYKKKL
jgi:phosphohistidine phosphatase